MRKFGIIIICLVISVFAVLVYLHLKEPAPPEPSSSQEPTALPSEALPSQSPTPEIENSGTYDARLTAADALISQDVEAGFPGAVLLVSLDGQTVFHKAYGYLKIFDGDTTLSSPAPMQPDTVFDLASLTKIYATAFSIMKLTDAGLVSLDAPLYTYLPDFNKEEYDKITIRHLLCHTSGFPSDVKFFRPDVEEGEIFYSTDRDKTVSLLSQVSLENPPGESAQYSDIGYMVLGAVVEKVSGMRIDEFVKANFYEPLGIQNQMSYLPLENGFAKENIACTERIGNTRDGLADFPGIRTYTLQGEVHDEKAYYSMGGVSGHAGLFSDAEAIDVLNQVLLGGGANMFSAETASLFTSVCNDATYQLGFNDACKIGALEGIVPESTLCHTGWTGVFSLIDKKNNLSIVLLTNKRHSPITDGEFEGALYETGKYYAVARAVYEGLGLG